MFLRRVAVRIPKRKQTSPDKELFPNLDTFDWSEVGQQTLLGQGAYGVVNVARYRERDVMLKIPHEITGIEKEFAKEIKLLNNVRFIGQTMVIPYLRTRLLSPLAMSALSVRASF